MKFICILMGSIALGGHSFAASDLEKYRHTFEKRLTVPTEPDRPTPYTTLFQEVVWANNKQHYDRFYGQRLAEKLLVPLKKSILEAAADLHAGLLASDDPRILELLVQRETEFVSLYNSEFARLEKKYSELQWISTESDELRNRIDELARLYNRRDKLGFQETSELEDKIETMVLQSYKIGPFRGPRLSALVNVVLSFGAGAAATYFLDINPVVAFLGGYTPVYMISRRIDEKFNHWRNANQQVLGERVISTRLRLTTSARVSLSEISSGHRDHITQKCERILAAAEEIPFLPLDPGVAK